MPLPANRASLISLSSHRCNGSGSVRAVVFFLLFFSITSVRLLLQDVWKHSRGSYEALK